MRGRRWRTRRPPYTRGRERAVSVRGGARCADPTSSETWRSYAECEIEGDARTGERDDDAVKSVFSRCLLACPSAKLWRSYTRYMVAANDPHGRVRASPLSKPPSSTRRTRCREDIDAGPLWVDAHVSTSCGRETRVPRGGGERRGLRSARNLVRRRAFRRAVVAPTDAVDALSPRVRRARATAALDPTLAKALLAEIAEVDRTRTVLRERKRRTKELNVGRLTFPFAPEDGAKTEKTEKTATTRADRSPSPARRRRLWRAYARWERSNPQALEPDADAGEVEHPQVTARVALAYDQALMSLRHFPEVWLEYAAWHELKKRPEDAAASPRALRTPTRGARRCCRARGLLGAARRRGRRRVQGGVRRCAGRHTSARDAEREADFSQKIKKEAAARGRPRRRFRARARAGAGSPAAYVEYAVLPARGGRGVGAQGVHARAQGARARRALRGVCVLGAAGGATTETTSPRATSSSWV